MLLKKHGARHGNSPLEHQKGVAIGIEPKKDERGRLAYIGPFGEPADGYREILAGIGGTKEDKESWRDFLRHLSDTESPHCRKNVFDEPRVKRAWRNIKCERGEVGIIIRRSP